MERFKMIASVYLILIKDDQILLLKRQNTGYQDGNYGVPSGHVEDNETLAQGFIREMKEEIDVDIQEKDVKLVHIMHRKENDIRLDFFFTAANLKQEPKNAEPEKCSDLSWFALSNLPDNMVPYVRIAIENFQKGILYSEVGWK